MAWPGQDGSRVLETGAGELESWSQPGHLASGLVLRSRIGWAGLGWAIRGGVALATRGVWNA